MIYCVVLNPAVDAIYSLDELKVGSTTTGCRMTLQPAGKGINVARVAAALGEEVCVIGVLPENNKRQFTTWLDSQKIRHSFLSIDGNVRINTTILEKHTLQVTHLSSEGSTLSLRIADEFIESLQKMVCPGDLCAFCGSLPRGLGDDLYQRLIKICRQKKAITLLDTREIAFSQGIRAKPDMIKPNLEELQAHFGEPVNGVGHLALKGKRLLDGGVKSVFISLGADGLIALNDSDCLLCSSPQVLVKDTVGCGDAMVAGLLVARQRKFSFPETCRMAVACGASNAMHEGPGEIDRNDVATLMEEVRIESV